jgi:hypothetical protein
LLFVISSPSAVSSELYRVNLHDANFARNYKIKAALEKASAEISARGMSIIRPAAAADLESRGVAIFAKACFGHPSPSKRQKLNATANAFGAPAAGLYNECHQ